MNRNTRRVTITKGIYICFKRLKGASFYSNGASKRNIHCMNENISNADKLYIYVFMKRSKWNKPIIINGPFTPAIFSTISWTLTFRLSNGWHCTKWVHSHLRFGQLLPELKSSIMGYVPIFCDCVDWKVHAIVHA